MITFIIIIFVLLLVLSAFFSGTETAYFNLKVHREDIHPRLKKLLSHPRRLLVSILTGNTIINVAIGSFATLLTSNMIGASTGIILLQVIIVSLLIIIFGELVPKTFAVRYSKLFANVTYYPLRFFMILLSPLSFILNFINKIFLRLIPMEEKPFDTEEELEILAELGEEGGGLDEEESEMIKSIIKFDDKAVREIMTPRVDIHGLSTTSTLDDAMDLIAKKQFSKIPIYKDTIDEIVCILYAKDVVPYLLGSRHGIDLTSISRDAYFVPEQKPIDDLLGDFKEKKTSLAIVVDEWGGTSGLVTLEDIVEEVMGEIRDPFDIEKIPIEKSKDGSFIIDGKISIYDLEEEIEDIIFPEQRDYDTLGGLILDKLENIPAEGEKIVFSGWEMEVLKLDGNRITKVKLTK